MASVGAVRDLARGVTEWNARRGGADDDVDLTGIKIVNARLQGLDLSHMDLDGAELKNVDLRGANFESARVNGVTLVNVSLDDASFRNAEVKGSDFDRVCMRRCNFADVSAFELRIRRSIMAGADLRRARFRGYTHLYNCDLSDTKLSDLVVEMGVLKRPVADPQRLGQLRAAGFRQIDLPNLPLAKDHPDCRSFSILAPDEEYGIVISDGKSYWISEGRYDVFISHVSKYKETVATPLANELEARGLRVWIDERRIGLSDGLDAIIEFGIRASRFGVVLLTPDFFGRVWTDKEFALLTDKRIFLVLHGIEPEQLKVIHPGLDTARLHLTWTLGASEVGARIFDEIRRPPRDLG